MTEQDDRIEPGQDNEGKIIRPRSVTIISILLMIMGALGVITFFAMIAQARPSGGIKSLLDWEVLLFFAILVTQPVGHFVVGRLLYKMKRLGFWLYLPLAALNCFIDAQEGRVAVLILVVSLGIVSGCVLPHWKKLR
jgi:hypothetical protein